MPINRDKTQAQPGAVTAPGVGSSGTDVLNATGQDVVIYVQAATITAAGVTPPGGSLQALYSQASGVANWCIVLPVNWSVRLTYTGSPTWLWMAY